MKKFDYKMGAKSFNTTISSSTLYTRDNLRVIFRDCGLPHSTEFIMALEESLIITKGKTRGMYRIKTPVHFLEFEKAHRKAKEAFKNYPCFTTKNLSEEEAAIQLLKSKGYLILKQL